MTTIELPQPLWTRALDEFSQLHSGQLVTLVLVGETLGVQPQIRELPLRGVVSEPNLRDPIITIDAASADDEHLTHIVRRPIRVQIDRRLDGSDSGLTIESMDGTAAILKLENAALPATIDRFARPRRRG